MKIVEDLTGSLGYVLFEKWNNPILYGSREKVNYPQYELLINEDHFLIFFANEAILKRENVRGPEIVLRTFDPGERGYLSLNKIDPKNEFEIEFHHIVQYELVTDSLDNVLFVLLEDVAY